MSKLCDANFQNWSSKGNTMHRAQQAGSTRGSTNRWTKQLWTWTSLILPHRFQPKLMVMTEALAAGIARFYAVLRMKMSPKTMCSLLSQTDRQLYRRSASRRKPQAWTLSSSRFNCSLRLKDTTRWVFLRRHSTQTRPLNPSNEAMSACTTSWIRC